MTRVSNKSFLVQVLRLMRLVLCVVVLISFFAVQRAYASEQKYVTPQEYGAAADGVTDDSVSFQMAIDSGYPVFIPEGDYYIKKTIKVYNKKNLWVQGSSNAIIHRAHDNSKRTYLFNLQNCESCMFKNLVITSDIEGTGTIPNGHMRPSTKSSNILAFGGKANKEIYFYNNSFTNMESDYWFNDNTEGWNDIVIKGWYSRNSATALFGQNCKGLTIADADVILNTETAGDGDHCIYIADGSSKIRIRNSTFDAGTGDYEEKSPNSVLTFHRTSLAEENEYVDDVVIDNCIIKGSCFLYGNGGSNETITVRNCKFEETFARGNDYTGAFGGNSNYIVMNSDISVKTFTVTGNQDSRTGVLFYNCSIDARELDSACFANSTNLWVYDCDITLKKMLLYTQESNGNVNVTFNNCTIYSLGENYLFSKRNVAGTVAVTGCTIQNEKMTDYLVYSGKSSDMSGFVIYNCTIDGYKKIANDKTIRNARIINTWLNGELIN